MKYTEYSHEQLVAEKQALDKKYASAVSQGLNLNMARGILSRSQLDLTQDMLGVLNTSLDCRTANGVDCRNYGLLDGIPEAKDIFAEILGVESKNIIVGGNSSLNLMYDTIARAMLYGVPGSPRPWMTEGGIKFLCPCPGYDRHFAICESLGIDMIPITMNSDGPDMDTVEELVSTDEKIKGIWCVPKYSNPEGVVYSDEVVRRFASLKPAAPDFRIFWDNAYVVHAFVGEPARQLNLYDEACRCGNPNMPYIFTSTSKISFPGSGISAVAASDENIASMKKHMTVQTIGPDKLNQLRHVRYFGSYNGILEHMKKHAAILAPKFSLVNDMFEKRLGGLGIAEWTKPSGGYFVSLNVPDGCASRVYTLMSELGVKLTPAGATFPYKKDPRDRNLRVAPTYPPLDELETAAEMLCLCVRIASCEKLLG